MPRKSADSLSVAPIAARRASFAPPTTLSAPAARIWREIASQTPGDHFRPSDAPLFASYVEVCAQLEAAAAELARSGAVVDGKPSPWLAAYEKLVRSQSALALRLRLCPSARLDPKTVGRAQASGAPKIDFTRR